MCVVVSTAIKRDNPELMAARAQRIPVVRRAEMLAELMRLKSCVAIAGTHGKTTTTSMVAALLDAGGLDPTVINGGIINAYGTNARLGAGDWMVVEADESDGTFLKLPADVAIVTNIDPEHLDHFETFEAVKDAFRHFVENVPFYGFAVMCIDHPEVQALVGSIEDRRIITYGENPQADVRLVDLDPSRRRLAVHGRCSAIADRRPCTRSEILTSADAGPAQRAERHWRRSRSRTSSAFADDVIRKALARLRRREAPLHPDRRVERRHRHRRLRPSPGRDRGGAEGGARRHARAGSSRWCSRIASPACRSLFEQFCTCFNDADTVIVRRCLSGRRGADRGRRPRPFGAGPARARPSPRDSRCRIPAELAR